MTVDSIPISELGQRGAGFMAAHGVASYLRLLGGDKFTIEVFFVCIYI